MHFRWIGTVFKYTLGVLCWFILFGLLRHYCVLDIYDVMDGLGMKELHDGLAENSMGDIAYHLNGGECGGDSYIYVVRYHPTDLTDEGESRSLSSLVDVATWQYVGGETISSTFVDANHTYVLYTISDGDFIRSGSISLWSF